MSEKSQCTQCSGIFCYPNIAANQHPNFDEAPAFCPTKLRTDIIGEALSHYDSEEVKEFARLASVQEFECYEHTPDGIRTRIPRIEETVQFAQKNGFKRLGLAFCSGLANEARIVVDILERRGFEVISVCCKVGAIPKERIGIEPEEKISGPKFYESMCNPITQAEILNEEGVDFNILIGLCVGHDSLFIKYCQAPMTVLAVKDRVTGHNPLAAIYLSHGPYYGRLRRRAQA
ncbi:MAG: DUF1847 domain-containing protein [Dehalococcoidales bacterium]|nr:MAG: DUF1847 domain-containing protein [Dehalococcoidales bacterium]